MGTSRKSKAEEPKPAEEYTVLARRYRPQQFTDLVGQEPVARALINALKSNRVAHAYLFTGARGVGKTSTARILAKALNCVKGPTPTPCDQCDACKSIASGEDVDVLEIDGASNRGIDEVREIRSNVQYRPSRTRYKIYIIDEVHMLTTPAFNALLKTLEEPPAHVKFIFATTESNKIPITILSRCQRFDFAGIGTAGIVDRLREIVSREGMKSDDEALALVARRAAGSMRDAQSLLDQLLAFGSEHLTVDQVHQLLGTAHDERVTALATAVLERDSKKALELLGGMADGGLQLGELLDQLIAYWRDLMVVNCAGAEGQDLSVTARYRETLVKQAATQKLDTILAGLDILAATKARLRGSNHGRVLMEMAIVRLSRLDDLVSLAQLAEWVGQSGGAPSAGGKSKPSAQDSSPARLSASLSTAASSETLKKKLVEEAKLAPITAASPQPLSPAAGERGRGEGGARPTALGGQDATGRKTMPTQSGGHDTPQPLSAVNLPQIWQEVLAQVGKILANQLEKAGLPAIFGPNALVLRFPGQYNSERKHCEEPERLGRIEEVLRRVTGLPCQIRVESAGGNGENSQPIATEQTMDSSASQRRPLADVEKEPLIQRAIEVLGARIVPGQVDEGFGAGTALSEERAEAACAEE